jgi:hypothetical protein
MAGYSNLNLYGYSDPFTITGMGPDSMEPNDSGAVARILVPGEGRLHLNLGQGDRDWFRIEAKARTLYMAEATFGPELDAAWLSMYYKYNGGQLSSKTRSAAIADSVLRITSIAYRDTTYHLSLGAGASKVPYGSYDFELTAYPESDWKIAFASPSEGAIVAPGDTMRIQWSQRKDFGGDGYVMLLKGSSHLQNLSNAVKSTGALDWKVPAGLLPGTDYSIQVVNVVDGADLGTNRVVFTISAPP